MKIQTPRDCVGDDRPAFFCQQLYQAALFRHKRVDLKDFAIEEVGNAFLLQERRYCYRSGDHVAHVNATLCCGLRSAAEVLLEEFGLREVEEEVRIVSVLRI